MKRVMVAPEVKKCRSLPIWHHARLNPAACAGPRIVNIASGLGKPGTRALDSAAAIWFHGRAGPDAAEVGPAESDTCDATAADWR
ncbi:hypothetical protein [Dokdonella sp.]|uniref:hypothetical protein n=1 Tax=Dokdonella sp. TaxID=2291710 RepID=UPI0025C71DF6|nr:hypothetical protein [Dokdonella sp.]